MVGWFLPPRLSGCSVHAHRSSGRNDPTRTVGGRAPRVSASPDLAALPGVAAGSVGDRRLALHRPQHFHHGHRHRPALSASAGNGPACRSVGIARGAAAASARGLREAPWLSLAGWVRVAPPAQPGGVTGLAARGAGLAPGELTRPRTSRSFFREARQPGAKTSVVGPTRRVGPTTLLCYQSLPRMSPLWGVPAARQVEIEMLEETFRTAPSPMATRTPADVSAWAALESHSVFLGCTWNGL